MYKLEHIRIVGWINLVGGMLTLIAGVIAQAVVGFRWEAVLTNNVIYYVMFGLGWFIFNQLVMAGLFKKLATDEERAKLTRLDKPYEGQPPGRWGQSYVVIEAGLMAIWVLSVLGLQLLLGTAFTLPIGGFAGGWLVGGGLGRLRFVGKIRLEETEQQRRFYFGDAWLGPRTSVSYYSERADEIQPVGEPAPITSQTSLPPGVKRRAVVAGSGSATKPDEVKRKQPPV